MYFVLRSTSSIQSAFIDMQAETPRIRLVKASDEPKTVLFTCESTVLLFFCLFQSVARRSMEADCGVSGLDTQISRVYRHQMAINLSI